MQKYLFTAMFLFAAQAAFAEEISLTPINIPYGMESGFYVNDNSVFMEIALPGPPKGAVAPAGIPEWRKIILGKTEYLAVIVKDKEENGQSRFYIDRDGDLDLTDEKVEGVSMKGGEIFINGLKAVFGIGGNECSITINLKLSFFGVGHMEIRSCFNGAFKKGGREIGVRWMPGFKPRFFEYGRAAACMFSGPFRCAPSTSVRYADGKAFINVAVEEIKDTQKIQIDKGVSFLYAVPKEPGRSEDAAFSFPDNGFTYLPKQKFETIMWCAYKSQKGGDFFAVSFTDSEKLFNNSVIGPVEPLSCELEVDTELVDSVVFKFPLRTPGGDSVLLGAVWLELQPYFDVNSVRMPKLTVSDSTGKTVFNREFSAHGHTYDSVIWKLPPDIPEGEYKAHVEFDAGPFKINKIEDVTFTLE
jgi:hypothetical protein